MLTIDLYLAIITTLFCSGIAYAAGYSIGYEAGKEEKNGETRDSASEST